MKILFRKNNISLAKAGYSNPTMLDHVTKLRAKIVFASDYLFFIRFFIA